MGGRLTVLQSDGEVDQVAVFGLQSGPVSRMHRQQGGLTGQSTQSASWQVASCTPARHSPLSTNPNRSPPSALSACPNPNTDQSTRLEGVPKLGDDEHIFPLDQTLVDGPFQTLARLVLVAVIA